MFCYVKYCVSSVSTARQPKYDRYSKVLKSSKIQLPSEPTNTDLFAELSKHSIKKNSLTNQITIEKSMEMIAKFRSQLGIAESQISNKITTDTSQNQENDTDIDRSIQQWSDGESKAIRRETPIDLGSASPNDFKLKGNKTFRARASNNTTRTSGSYNAPRKARLSLRSPRFTRKTHFDIGSGFAAPNAKFMMNINCYVQILIDYLYEQLSLDRAGNKLDLCDADGNMLKLFTYPKHYCGKYLLKDRKTYYIVRYELNDDETFKSIEPMLRKTTKEEAEMFSKVAKNVNRPSTQDSISVSSSDLLSMSVSKSILRRKHHAHSAPIRGGQKKVAN